MIYRRSSVKNSTAIILLACTLAISLIEDAAVLAADSETETSRSVSLSPQSVGIGARVFHDPPSLLNGQPGSPNILLNKTLSSTTAVGQQGVAAGSNPDSAKQSEVQTLSPVPITLAELERNHEANKTLNLTPLYLGSAVEMHSFEALREESKHDQSISLRDAIRYVLDHGMSIKISRESMNYQHYLTLSNLAGFVPSFTMQYNLTGVNVLNFNTTSLAQTFLTGVSFPVFQGGTVLYTMLAQRYREKAWQYTYKSTVSDVFLDVYQKYTNLLLQRVLMQIYAKTVEADEEQLRINQLRLTSGTGTRYDVMQSEARLAADRQSLLQQGITMRQAGLTLNLALNYPLEINLIPVEETLSEAPLFDEHVQLKTLLEDALRFQPGLRQYEYFRLTAARNIQAISGSLYPTVTFFALYQLNDTSVSPAGNGAALGGSATTSIASYLDSTFAGRVSNNALGQLYTFSPTSGSTSNQGANTAPIALPAASGGQPIANIQSGSLVSSGAVAPSIVGGGTGSGTGPNQNGSLQAPSGIFPGYFRNLQAGIQLNWTLPSFGLQTTASLLSAKMLARESMMQCNQELSLVIQQIHNDYLAMLTDRRLIDRAAASVAAYREALRLAKVGLENGVGTNLQVIQAQSSYVTALTSQAQAIVASNVAQAQLLHDMGMISATTLSSGYRPGVFIEPIPTGKRTWKKP
jgi:outer membrane protein TolC